MKHLKINLFALLALVTISCSGDGENADQSPTDKAKSKCEEITKEIHGSKEGFKINSSRADKSESVKLALDEKYESATKYIASVTFEVQGKEEFCTCYLNEELEVINKEMLVD